MPPPSRGARDAGPARAGGDAVPRRPDDGGRAVTLLLLLVPAAILAGIAVVEWSLAWWEDDQP